MKFMFYEIIYIKYYFNALKIHLFVILIEQEG